MEKLETGSETRAAKDITPLPRIETARLKALGQYKILYTEPEEIFDDITRLAADVCSAPFACLSFVESDRIFFKSLTGISSAPTDREGSFCALAIMQPDIFIVEDAQMDDRFKNNSMVIGNPGIRFYAAAPVMTPDGFIIGALSVMDSQPRKLKDSQVKALSTLASSVATQLDLRRKSIELDMVNSERSHMEKMVRMGDDLLSRYEKRNAELSDINAMLMRQSTERQQALESLAVKQERYALIARSANEGLWDWNISISLTHHDAPEDLLRNADTAMYRAKEKGRRRFELFDEGMHARAVALLQLETDLRKAILKNEFRLYYQPIISLANWHIMGFEALLRWEHPQQGFISPLEIIPVAEETGLILPIGQWVLTESCRQLKTWQEMFPMDPPLSISVNLSGKQFLQPDLIKVVSKILNRTEIEPSSLKIEITESAIIENIELATEKLKELKSLGLRVSLDDFGTGYSSLSYLHRFPIDTLKIDRSFVTRMSLPKNTEIVRTIVALASNLGMDVIAEGVETGDQIIQLAGMSCE